jgi:hypothetical protein
MEKFGIAHIAQIAMRIEPSHRAEMCSQLIFGDPYQVIEENGKWFKIKTLDCGYEGWIDAQVFNSLHPDDVESYLSADHFFVTDYLMFIREFESNVTFPIYMGSHFPYPNDGMLILGNAIFMIELPVEQQVVVHPGLSLDQVKLLKFASGYLRSPYLWGGRTPLGIDCSGLVQLAFKAIGIDLERDASQQVHQGETVDFFEQTEVGDVAFFDNEEGKIVHTGIVCGKGKILHASGFVRIDVLNQTGILNTETEKYTHNLRIIKRYLKSN